MAKNLKLNIKNTQLAAALQLGKVKKPAPPAPKAKEPLTEFAEQKLGELEPKAAAPAQVTNIEQPRASEKKKPVAKKKATKKIKPVVKKRKTR